jgi:hypothetical protein
MMIIIARARRRRHHGSPPEIIPHASMFPGATMTELKLESHPADNEHRLLDFESAEVRPGAAGGTWVLTVRGDTPCINMEVSLAARVYVRCPEHWGIEVVGYLPGGLCFTAMGSYDQAIPLDGITGSRGIEVIGARKSETFAVPGGCSDAGGVETRPSS